MAAFRDADPFRHARPWRVQARREAYEKVVACPLMRVCAKGGSHPQALFGGFWRFVDDFPEAIRDTYESIPFPAASATIRRFLGRSVSVLSGTLAGMESDERDHRTLWVRSSGRVGLSENDLQRWRVLPEITFLIQAIRSEADLGRRLLYFVAVEIVAEGIARHLAGAPRFVETMGEEGMRWFAAHLVDPDHATAHEAIAYKLALSVKRAAREPLDEESVNADILRCVDWFFAAGVACARHFARDKGSD